MIEKGLVQIYTGNGKGKTTASLGLALRAAGRGNRVHIVHFLKPLTLNVGEWKAIADSGLSISVEATEIDWDMAHSFEREQDVQAAKDEILRMLQSLAKRAAKQEFDVLILDEIAFCYSKGLVLFEDIKALLSQRDSHVEIVMTGRGADEKLIALADLVTEMQMKKHWFEKGIGSREGIEY